MPRRILLFFAVVFSLGAATPRPEFPQPQFERAEWLTLNGQWEFDFDDANAGLDAHWSQVGHKFGRQITVPYCFEARMSGIGDTGFHPWVWYRRAVTLPAGFSGKRTLLHFGAVDYRAMVWVNGQLAGSHEGGNTPFQFDITPLLHAGANELVVRAEDPPTDRSIPRGKQFWEPKSKSIFYTRTSGIWQPVWLEATGANYLERVNITPSNDGLVRFEARMARDEPDAEFSVEVRNEGKAAGSAMARAANTMARAAVTVAEPALWTPDSPRLYDVEFVLRRNGVVLDRVKSYFGFRSVGVENDRVTLNGRAIYVKMILDQGYWPESILTPPTDEAMQFDIRESKAMGFNGARKHQKLEDPRFLYWADKMGFLISSEMANAFLFDPEAAARYSREWTASIERDRNHPSIIMWVPINESWGVPNLKEPQQQDYLRGLYALTKALDPTRLVIDNDGWEHTNMTDLFAIHDYAKTGELLMAKYKNLNTTPGSTVPDNGKRALAPGNRYNGTPILLSEFGGIAFLAPGAPVPAESWGYAGVEKSAGDALARLTSLYEAIAKIPAFGGICYTQLTDVEQEANGLLTYDRKRKFDPRAIRALNDLLH